MTSEKRVDLKDVEPLHPVDAPETEKDLMHDADRVGLTSAQTQASTPAVGVTVEAQKDSPPEKDPLDELRRD